MASTQKSIKTQKLDPAIEFNVSVTRRVNRIIGQLKGIAKMADAGRDSIEIMQQVSAVKKAIDSLTQEILMKDIIIYLPPIKQQQITEMVKRAISL